MKKPALAFCLIVFGIFGVLSLMRPRPVQAGNRKSDTRNPISPSPSAVRSGSVITQAQKDAVKAHQAASRARAIKERNAQRASRDASSCSWGSVNSLGIYDLKDYERCGADNDAPRIQRAIEDAWDDSGGGLILVPAGVYELKENLVMRPGITIMGVNALPYDYAHTVFVRLNQKTSPQCVFDVGEGISDITIKDISLQSDSVSDMIGIYIHGGAKTPSFPDFQFHFDHLTFWKLDKGIYVYGEDLATDQSWQVETVRLENCNFMATKVGIHLDTHNTSWFMTNSAFSLEQGDVGIKLEKCGWITMVDLTASSSNWTPPDPEERTHGTPISTFVEVGQHQGLTMQTCATEHMDNSLLVTFASRDNVITLVGNRLQNKVDLSNSTQVASTGNRYEPNLVVVGENTNVFSTGDRFCPDGFAGTTPCPNGGDFVDTSGNPVNVSFRTGAFERPYCPYGVTCVDPGTGGATDTEYIYPDYVETATKVPAKFRNYVRMESGALQTYESELDPYGKGYIPLLVLSSKTNNIRPLFQLGTDAYYYTYNRDGLDGALEVEGNQEGHSFYKFITRVGPESTDTKSVTINNDGSVTYSSTDFDGLLNTTSTNGTVIYCTNCRKMTPCDATPAGNGALAKHINGAWDCD